MPSLSGITEIVGVRAVIIDVRQYLSDGRSIEQINERMAASELKLQKASEISAAATKTRLAANVRANADANAASAARLKAINLEIKAEDARANLAAASRAKPQGPSGQFISGATAQDIKDQSNAIIKAAQDAEGLKRLTLRTANQSGKEAISAGIAEQASLARTNVLIEQQAALEKQLASAKLGRIKAAASGVALVGTAVIAGTAAAAISSAAKYQQELSKINVLTSATDAETEQLGQQFLTLSTQIPVSASDLAAASYKLLSSGIKDTGTALEITTQAAKAAVAGQADIKDIISATIAVLNGYPKGAITAKQVNDILFAGVKEGAAEFNDFAGSIGKLIPIAAALGVPFDQLTASLAVLTNGGLNAEEAATGLRAILNDLAKDEGSKQATDALAAFGLTVEDVRRSIVEKGLPQAMADLIKLFNGNLAAIEPIIPNIRGMVAALSAFGTNGKTTVGVLAAIDNSVGLVDQSFEKVKNNTANVAKLFSNELNVALIEIGNAILPSVTAALQDLVKWLQENRQEIQSFVSQGLQGIIDIGREAAKGIGVITKVLGELSDVMSSIVGQSNATKLALAAIGTGLAFALPGGEVILGLTAILVLLGQIQDLANGKSSGKNGLGRTIVSAASTIAGGVVGGVLSGGNPLAIGGGALAGNALGGTLNDLLFGKDTKSGSGSAAAGLDRVNKAAEQLGKQTLPPLAVNIGGVDKAAKTASDALKKVAQDFQKSSEAAGEVESITVALKKFGTINFQDANTAKLSAAQAGQIQGVDAVVRSQERSQAEAFNYVEAINAVSSAFKQSAAVGRQLVLDLAQASLSASQTALSNLFSRPTREVANLNVGLAGQQLQSAQLTQRNTPQINALNQQLKNIDKQIAAQNRANTQANRNAQQQQKQQQAAQKQQQNAAQSQLDALQLANTIAQIAAERQQAQLQKLIDANTKQASDLQEAFRKNIEDLQGQINTAIGKGDSATALSLVEQQRTATKQYREQSKALQKSTENLTTQQKAAQEAEAERQRQAKLAEALLQAQQKNTDATSANTDSTTSNTDAQDAQTQALEDSKQAIQDQIDALQAPIDASKQQEQTIQDSIAVFEAQTNVLKALGVAADQTLLTQQQQAVAAQHFIDQISYASGQAKILADNFYAFIPGAKEANTAFMTLQGAVNAINGKIDPLLLQNFDAVNARLDLLKKATDDVTTSFNNSTAQANQAAQASQQTISDWQSAQEQILAAENDSKNGFAQSITRNSTLLDKAFDTLKSSITSAATSIGSSLLKSFGGLFKGITGHAAGGLFTKPTLGVIGEAGPEVLLPIGNPTRTTEILREASLSGYGSNIRTLGGGGNGGIQVPIAQRQIIGQLSPSMTATLASNNPSSSVFAPSITVTGETLDTMEAVAIRALQAAFRDARAISSRGGGLITQGIGPGRGG